MPASSKQGTWWGAHTMQSDVRTWKGMIIARGVCVHGYFGVGKPWWAEKRSKRGDKRVNKRHHNAAATYLGHKLTQYQRSTQHMLVLTTDDATLGG